MTNRSAIGKQLEGLAARLCEVQQALADGNDSIIHELLTNAKVQRDRILTKGD